VLGANQEDAPPGDPDRGLSPATQSESDTHPHSHPHALADAHSGQTERHPGPHALAKTNKVAVTQIVG